MINLPRYFLVVILIISVEALISCASHHQNQLLEINPLVIPAGVPPIQMDNYFDIPAIPSQPDKPVSLIPPGSILTKSKS